MRNVTWLLALVALWLLCMECGTRLAFDRASSVQRRIHDEYQRAVELGQDGAVGRDGLLVVGNSLLEADVRFADIQDALASKWDSRRLVIENTSYLDWYYGLRRLFAQGARPRTVALMLGSMHLVHSSIRGGYSAHYMMGARDVVRVANELKLNRTEKTTLLFEYASKWYAVRAEVRKWLLGLLMPNLPQLTALLTTGSTAVSGDDRVYATSVRRLRALNRLAAHFGARFVLLIAPTPDDKGEGGSTTICRAGVRTGVPVIAIPPGIMDAADFSDGFHLNEIGARRYTGLILPVFQKTLTLLQDGGGQTVTTRLPRPPI